MARPAGATVQAVEVRSKSKSKNEDYTSEGVEDNDVFLLPVSDYQVMLGVTILGAIVRLYRIYQPSSVVFDEVQYVVSFAAPLHCPAQANKSFLLASVVSLRSTSRASSSWTSTLLWPSSSLHSSVGLRASMEISTSRRSGRIMSNPAFPTLPCACFLPSAVSSSSRPCS